MPYLTDDIHDVVVQTVFDVINYRVDVYNNYSIPVLDTMFSVLIHYFYRSSLAKNHAQIGWLQGFFATLVMGCGGGSTVAILRGEPIGILKSNEFWVIHGVTYWLMFSNNQFYRLVQLLFAIPPIEYAFLVSDGFLRAMAMLQFGVEGVESTIGSHKYAAQLISGCLAGIGGGFFMDAFQLHQHQWSFGTPQSLRVVSNEMKITFGTVVFYLASQQEFICEWVGEKVFTKPQAQAWSAILLTLGLIINSIVSTNWHSKLSSFAFTSSTTPVIIQKNKNNSNSTNKTNKKSQAKKKNQAKKLD